MRCPQTAVVDNQEQAGHMVSYRKSLSANTYKATWKGPARETQKESVIRRWLEQDLLVSVAWERHKANAKMQIRGSKDGL